MKKIVSFMLAAAFAIPLAGMIGCDADKEIIDVETPNGDFEVEQDADTGALEIED